jgi:hypothetical protein
MTTQLADTGRYSHARFLLNHPSIRDPHIYWPAMVAFLAEHLTDLHIGHRSTCTAPDCPTCGQLDQAAALLDVHADLQPHGWACPTPTTPQATSK